MSGFTTRDLTWAALLTALIAAGAFITIPLGPVPFTLQVLFVLMAGMILGPRLAGLSVVAYLLLGLVAPVYAGGSSGIGALLGPTGGFLIGFIPASVLTGYVSQRGHQSLASLASAGVLGLAPIYLIGTTWLALQLHLSASAALATGVLPFIWLDIVKAAVAALAARSVVSLPLGLPAPRSDR